ncbi:hypothetical protein LTR66_003286 [Elasticomyces elasticus]|nr:hypothetical protein LTR66_003286 [Elasticomyces elasticus]
MGFRPSIDSYEEWLGNRSIDRREVLAWSAGAELIVRVKNGQGSSLSTSTGTDRLCDARRDEFGNTIEWWTYKPFSSVEGKDDITSVNVLKPPHLPDYRAEEFRREKIVISTANGDLHLLEIPTGANDNVVKTYFVTNGRAFLAANLSDGKIALYPVGTSSSKIEPLSQTHVTGEKRNCRIWGTKFLNDKHFAVGLGPSNQPIHVFEVRPEGLSNDPVRKFGLQSDDTNRQNERLGQQSSSVYPIVPLSAGTHAGGSEGAVFLSGGYDGTIRAHDMRASSAVVATYADPTDDSAIYCLLPQGRERIIAGTARHSLIKVFDLRMTGGRKYCYEDDSSTGPVAGADSLRNSAHHTRGDWNLFINPRDRYSNHSWHSRNSWMRRSAESSIYSLSSPSSFSPYVYAGIENAIVEFNFSSSSDSHPDPMFGHHPIRQTLSRRRKTEVLNLAMYSQDTDGTKEAMKLRVQGGIDENGRDGSRVLQGLDERWRDVSEL